MRAPTTYRSSPGVLSCATVSKDESDDEHLSGEASRFAAHIDRGWGLFERGEFAGARESAVLARDLCPGGCEAPVLLGAIASATLQPEAAIEHYARALELDADLPEALIPLAQIWLLDMQAPSSARELCERALETSDLPHIDRLDLRVIAAESAAAENDERCARAYIEDADEAPLLRAAMSGTSGESEAAIRILCGALEDDAPDEEERAVLYRRCREMALRMARIYIEYDEAQLAREWLERAIVCDSEDADAWYLLSEAQLRLGDVGEAMSSSLRVLRLDLAEELPTWCPSDVLFHAAAREFVDTSDVPELSALVAEDAPTPLLCRELPSEELVLEGMDPRVPAVLLAHRSEVADSPPQVTALVVYRRNVLRAASSIEQLPLVMGEAVLEELAAFYGFSPERRARLGLPAVPGSPAKGRAH